MTLTSTAFNPLQLLVGHAFVEPKPALSLCLKCHLPAYLLPKTPKHSRTCVLTQRQLGRPPMFLRRFFSTIVCSSTPFKLSASRSDEQHATREERQQRRRFRKQAEGSSKPTGRSGSAGGRREALKILTATCVTDAGCRALRAIAYATETLRACTR